MSKPPGSEASEWEIPRLRTSFSMTLDSDGADEAEFFDVKFYPYNPVGSLPVFAAASKKHAVICRMNQVGEKEKDKNPCEILRVIRDDDATARNCTCCWSKDPVTERPWLCVAGNDAKIKIYDVVDGTLVRTLVGHGGGINDISTSPDNPSIIASASDDTTVKIWSLDPAHKKQPCMIILGGEGHLYDLLSVAFHNTGRHVLSAGHDQVINLWTLPDVPKGHVDTPYVLHYPHFSTTEIHNNLVDCVAFYGDLILSRSCHEEKIVLWRVEGFNSKNPPLTPSQAPTTYDPKQQTRSAFATITETRSSLFTRLLQFNTPDCGRQFFMRFRMFHVPNKHAILAFANAKGKTFFWDFSRFGAYNRFMDDLRQYSASQDPNAMAAAEAGTAPVPPPPPPKKPDWLPIKKEKKPNTVSNLRINPSVAGSGDKDSMVSASPDPESGLGLGGYNQRTLAEWAKMYGTGDPQAVIAPHRLGGVDSTFVGRQVAWSPEGEWCVVVGNLNNAIIYHRWAKDAKTAAGSSKDQKGSTPVPVVGATAAATMATAAGASGSSSAPGSTVVPGPTYSYDPAANQAPSVHGQKSA